MPRRLLSSLRDRATALLRSSPSPDVAPPAEVCDVLRALDVASYGDGTASFGAMFAAEPHRSALDRARIEADIVERWTRVDALQPGYQPAYGMDDRLPAKRRDHLERNVRIVHELLKDVGPKHQVRIVDIGCNLGYVSMRIAETYPNVVGLEISRAHLELCRLLAARAASSARFFSDDALALMDGGSDDLESVDVVLLYNVVHQFIFHRGFAATQALLAKLASRVDALVVELALKSDYVKHGKDHLLPERPEEVLAACADVETVQLHATPRPVYLLRRRTARIGAIAMQPQRIQHSLNPDPRVSRKYYTGAREFLKLYRFVQPGDREMYEREVDALRKLAGTNVAPQIIEAVSTAQFGAVLMSRVGGDRLVQRVYNTARPLRTADRRMLTREYLRVAKVVHEHIGYQNDLQGHNLLWAGAKRLVLVDYEQAGPTPSNDPFGLLLWSLFDFWGGRDKRRPAAIRSLRLSPTQPPAERLYPDFAGLTLPADVAELVAAARRGGDWGSFVAQWFARFAAPASSAR